MTPDAVFDLVIRASYLLVAALTLIGLARRRDAARLDIALPFNSLAIVILIPLLREATGFSPRWLSVVSSLLLLAQPYLFMRLLQHFRAVPVAIERIVIAGMVLSGIALIVSPTPLPTFLSVAIVAYFVGAELYAVVSFVQGALRTRGVTRSQLLLIAAGSGLFALIILLTGIGVILPAALITVSPVVRVGTVLSALSYYLGFASPRWLRGIWQRSELHHFLQGAAQFVEVEQRIEAISYLCQFAIRAVGGQVALVALWDDAKQDMAFQETGDDLLRQSLAVDGDDVVGRAWRGQKPLASIKLPDFGPVCAGKAAALGAKALYAVPISVGGQKAGLLLVFLRGALFPEDDLDLLMLFVWQSARTLRFLSLIDDLRYQSNILESVSDIIVSTDGDAMIQSWNEAAETTYGRKAGDVIGKPISEILNPRFSGMTTEQVTAQVMAQGFFRGEVTHSHKDGHDIHLLVSRSVIRSARGDMAGFVVVGHDITERKQAEERFRGLLEAAPDGMVITNSRGQIVLANQQTQRLFGYGRDELLGQSVEILVPERFRGIHPGHRSRYFSEPRPRPMGQGLELYGQRKDGSEFPIEISLSPLETPDGILVSSAIRDITERKEAEKALHKSEERFHQVLDHMVEGCQIIGFDWRYLYLNDAAVRFSWQSREDLLGQTVMARYPGIETSEMFVVMQRCMDDRSPRSQDFEFTYPDGTRRWFDLSIQPSPEGLFIISSDITERKRMEDALRHERDLMQALMDNLPYMIYFKDDHSRFIRINHVQARFLGLDSPEQAIGKTDIDFQPVDITMDSLAEERHIMMTGEPSIDRIEFNPTVDGQPRWVTSTKSAIKDSDGNIKSLVGISRDVTQAIQTEEKIKELNATLIERAADLEAANKELEAFSYSVSHDLRAPLRTVDGFSRILLEEHGPNLPADASRYLVLVREGAQQMGRLIDDLLEFSRLGRQPLKRQPVQPGDLARQVWSDLDMERSGRQVEVSIADLPSCKADPALLRQVYANLLTNALKFTRQREPARIEVGCNTLDGDCVYFVRDNGAGFDMKYVDKLFGVFQRLHRAEDYEGTGVGLATVQRIIHRHGGHIWAEAEVDKGAIFYFTLGGGGSYEE